MTTAVQVLSQKDRREWINTLLELQTAGLAYRNEYDTILSHVTSDSKHPLHKTSFVSILESFRSSDFLNILLTPSDSREVFCIIREVTQESQKKPSEFIAKLSLKLQSWITAGSHSSYGVTHFGETATVNDISEIEERDTFILFLGIASLLAFTQVNYAGVALPQIAQDENLVSNIFTSFLTSTELNQFFTGALETNGEDAYTCIYFPFLLTLATAILSPVIGVAGKRNMYTGSSFSLPVASIWSLRSVSVLNDTLLDSTEDIRKGCKDVFSSLAAAYSIDALSDAPMNDDGAAYDDQTVSTTANTSSTTSTTSATSNSKLSISESGMRVVKTSIILESAKLSRKYWQHKRSELLHQEAQVQAGFRYKLTGVMGRNTRHQTTSHAQLTVLGATKKDMLTQSTAVVDNTHKVDDSILSSIPNDLIEDIPLDTYDEVLLALPKYDQTNDEFGTIEDDESPIFSALAQSWAINQAEYVQMTNAHTDLTNYEMLAYVNVPLYQQLRFEGVSSFSPIDGNAKTITENEGGCEGEGEVESEGSTVASKLILKPSSPDYEPTLIQGDSKVFHSLEEEALIRIPWGVHVKAIQLRSLLEAKDGRRNIRSMVQLESIGNQFPTSLGLFGDMLTGKNNTRKYRQELAHVKIESKDVLLRRASWRCNNIYVSCVAPWWAHKRTYADYASAAGLRQSALDSFIQIGLWERVIESYIELGRKSQAETLVRSRLPNKGYLSSTVSKYSKITSTTGDGETVINEEDESESAITTDSFDNSDTFSDTQTNVSAITDIDEEFDLVSIGTDDESYDEATDNASDIGFDTASDNDEGNDSVSDLSTPVGTSSVKSDDKDVQERFLELGAKKKSEAARSTAYRRGLDLPQHKLWCLLGDITNTKEYYQKSWITSQKSYPKAKRCLGMINFQEKNYLQAYDDLMDALEINSALPDIWFTAGNCALELENYRSATDCFSRVVAISPRYPEGWNNLAACHLYLKNNRAALGALEHATRLKRDSWKMWENYLHCALDLNEYSKALVCLERLAELRGTTDSGTLLPIQYTGTQAKLHMMAVSALTKAAEEDSKKVFEKNITNTSDVTSIDIDYSNPNRIMEQSFLSHRVINVLNKLESVAAAMVAADANMGGRKRGGGVDAGASNSMTAALEDKKRENKAKLAKVVADKKKAEWLAKRKEERKMKKLAEGGDDSDSSDDDDDAEDNTEEIPGVEYDADGNPVLPKAALHDVTVRTENANEDELEKISSKYQIFLQECLARVHAGVHSFTQAANAREKQTLFLVNNGKDIEWTNSAKTIDMVSGALHESIRLYSIASQVELHVQTHASAEDLAILQKELGHLDAMSCLTSARYLADRIYTLTQNAMSGKAVSETTPLLTDLLKSCADHKAIIVAKENELLKKNDAVATTVAVKDKDISDAYYGADDDMNSYW